MSTQPWPEVSECYWPAPSLVAAGHSCSQCDGSHRHDWRAGETSAGWERMRPVRCVVCGGRKCDVRRCFERRHHSGHHVDIDGRVLYKVGA